MAVSRTPMTVSPRPTATSSTVAVLAAATALLVTVGLRSTGPAVGVALVGLAIAAVGAALVERTRRIPGRFIEVAGLVVALVALPTGIALTTTPGGFIALLPGLVGLLVLAVGLLPVAGTGSRTLVRVGTALTFVAVLAAVLFHLAASGRSLVAVVLVVVAWDSGDNAIGLGAQLGRRARTWPVELAHSAATGLVGLVGVVAAGLAGGIPVASLPLESFVLVLAAVTLLVLALHG